MTNFKGVIIESTAGTAVNVDSITGSLRVISIEHAEIHSGEHFEATDTQTVANGTSIYYVLETPDDASRIHFTYEVSFTAVTDIDLYEDGDRNGTNAMTEFNNDRNSATAAVLTCEEAYTGGTTDGTLLKEYHGGIAGGANGKGGNPLRSNELILKQNTQYILKITSGTNGNLISVEFEWYEESVPAP